MVGSYAHGSAMLFAYSYQRHKLSANAVKLCLVGCFGIVDGFKTLLVSIVTRIYAHLFYNARCQLCCVWRKMYVCYERHRIASLSKLLFYLCQILCFLD